MGSFIHFSNVKKVVGNSEFILSLFVKYLRYIKSSMKRNFSSLLPSKQWIFFYQSFNCQVNVIKMAAYIAFAIVYEQECDHYPIL